MSSAKRKKARRQASANRRKILLAVVVLTIAALAATLLAGYLFVASAAQDIPSLKNAKRYFRADQTTRIYDANGNLLTELFIEQNRETVPLDKISPMLQKAVIAIEDRRFYKHEGVDWRAIARALVSDVEAGRIVEGGSTLTQQLVKNTIVTPEKSFNRKIREASLAYELEKKFSKKEILELYLNTIFFGQSAYGAETAAHMFFGKPAADLTLPEAALLAGVIRSPNSYSPYVNLEASKARRDRVLLEMVSAKLITLDEARQAAATPVEVKPLESRNVKFPYFIDLVKRSAMEDTRLGATPAQRANALYRGGLRIYTTIDPQMQEIAEQAAWSTLDRPDDPGVGLAAVEPKTGYIKAMVGGKDYGAQKYDFASQAQRQPGSSFKPFVLATAFENGISAAKVYDSSPASFNTAAGPWKVNNSEGHGAGMLDLSSATKHSVNAVFARLILEVGADKVAEMAHKLGIVSYIEPFPAIALGGLGKGVSPLEMAAAYSTFANQGNRVKAVSITKITDAKGQMVLDNGEPKQEQVISPVTAYLVTNMLEGVIQSGTGRGANIGRPAAGKTGTTDNYGDAWFVGYTPDLAAAVWVGYPQGRVPMRSVHGMTVYGGTFPAQVWRKFMSQALAGKAASNFTKPSGIYGVRICTSMPGLWLATENCPPEETRFLQYAKGDKIPTEPCPLHKAANVKVPGLLGMSASEAERALADAGLKSNAQSAYSPSTAAGQVMSQDPAADAEVAKDSIVTFVVSGGRDPNQVVVPELLGQSEAKASVALKKEGLIGTLQWQVTSDPSKVGKVLWQSPRAGTIVNKGSEITVRVGKLP